MYLVNPLLMPPPMKPHLFVVYYKQEGALFCKHFLETDSNTLENASDRLQRILKGIAIEVVTIIHVELTGDADFGVYHFELETEKYQAAVHKILSKQEQISKLPESPEL